MVNLLDTRLVGGDLAHAAYHLSKATLAELTTLTALEFAPELQGERGRSRSRSCPRRNSETTTWTASRQSFP